MFKHIKPLRTIILFYLNTHRRQNTHVSAVFLLFGHVFPLAKALTSPGVRSSKWGRRAGSKLEFFRVVWLAELKLCILLAKILAVSYCCTTNRLNHPSLDQFHNKCNVFVLVVLLSSFFSQRFFSVLYISLFLLLEAVYLKLIILYV